jgi:phospholipid N-methyltransferase
MTTKPVPRKKKSDGDMFDALAVRIGDQIKKGVTAFEEILSESKNKRRGAEDDEFMGYVKTYLHDRSIASVTPSSKYLVERMVKSAALEEARVVVEYGPAEGVITRHLLRNMRRDAKLIAVELNEKFFLKLTERVKDPRLIPVRGDVREISKILAARGLTTADRIISGLPFSIFTGRERHEILTKTSDLLNPGGRFVAFAYTTHLIPMLKDYFSDVDTQFEVRNIPPSFVFTALK